ncbi:MAG TPA: hypothetical protein VHX62_19290 [Solirubrobacteraceae bacterium]|nr:hypothetical protein [Solirubrobacteraceae bacterium]
MAAIVGQAGAAPTPSPITLGSTSGTPSMNVCLAMITCTYVPFDGAAQPALLIPSDGTITSFSINSGSGGDTVELRVLRPAGNGQYTGAGTSAAQTLTNGVTTFTVSMPVKAGDVLAVDNSDSALMFDTTSPTAINAYYEVPSLADGSTAAPNHDQSGLRLLMSAVEQPSAGGSTTNPTVTTVFSTTTVTTSGPPSSPGAPKLNSFSQSHATWRAGGKLAVVATTPPPVGTAFTFTLNQRAVATLTFIQRRAGRKVNGRCVAGAHGSGRKCTALTTRGTLAISGVSGANTLSFQGRVSAKSRLPAGSYTVKLQAANASGQRSATRSLNFTLAR